MFLFDLAFDNQDGRVNDYWERCWIWKAGGHVSDDLVLFAYLVTIQSIISTRIHRISTAALIKLVKNARF